MATEKELNKESSIWPPKGSTLSPDETLLRNPRDTPIGKYFEYDVENVEWCCDKMRNKQGTTNTFIKEDHVEGNGRGRCWYGKCPWCKTPLIFTVSGFCIDRSK